MNYPEKLTLDFPQLTRVILTHIVILKFVLSPVEVINPFFPSWLFARNNPAEILSISEATKGIFKLLVGQIFKNFCP